MRVRKAASVARGGGSERGGRQQRNGKGGWAVGGKERNEGEKRAVRERGWQ